MSLSVPTTPQKYQNPRIGEEHCGLKLRDSAEQDRRRRQQFPLPLLIRASGSPTFVRLVKPSFSSVNELYSYLLVTDKRLIIYNGQEAAITCRSKIAQIAYEFVASKELPTFADRVEIAKDDQKTELHFWRVLKRDGQNETKMEKENMASDFCGAMESFECDKVFETKSDGTIAILLEGVAPDIAILGRGKVLVFYFISEIYVWVGSGADKSLIESAVHFSESLKDYAKVGNCGRIVCQNGQSPMNWTILRRISEGIADTLFKYKFSKWTNKNYQRKKKCHQQCPSDNSSVSFSSLACDSDKNTSKNFNENIIIRETARKMSLQSSNESELRLEDVILRPEDNKVCTEALKVYNVVGERLVESGQQQQQVVGPVEFEADKCYVVEWEYRVERTGIRKLDGSAAEQRHCGRSRKCFFYWLGPRSTTADQSRCALALRDKDTDLCEHVRVEAGNEAPMLLHILGGLIVWGTGSEILCVIGSSGHCFVAQEMRSPIKFRSQGVYLRICSDFIECLRGEDCPEALLQSARTLAHKLVVLKGLRAAREVIDLRENVIKPTEWTKAPKMFRFHENELWEMACAHPKANFTFDQRDLRDCVVVDQGSHLWVWTANELSTPTFVLKVAFLYWYQEEFSFQKSVGGKASSDSSAHVIYGGAEPDEFKALFVEWEENENLDGRKEQKLIAVIAERLKLRSVEELRRRDFPPGCDTKHLEEYLSEEDFARVFNISREQFQALPRWRQLTMKKKVGLF